MRQFTDRAGRAWAIRVDLQSAMSLKTEAGIDALQVAEASNLIELGTDIVRLGDALWAVLAAQATAAGVSKDQLFTAIGGDELEAARLALVAECIDFFQPAKRETLHAAMKKFAEAEIAAMTKATEVMDQAFDQLQENMAAEFQKMLGRSTGSVSPSSSAELSASTRGPLPSAN